MTPKVGQIVLVFDSKRSGFDADAPNPGLITRVHGDGTVNAKVLADTSPAYDAEAIVYYGNDEIANAPVYCRPAE